MSKIIIQTEFESTNKLRMYYEIMIVFNDKLSWSRMRQMCLKSYMKASIFFLKKKKKKLKILFFYILFTFIYY